MYSKLLKGNDVAALLNISRGQAYCLMKRGDIPTIRFGKIVRVRVEDLGKFVEEHSATQSHSIKTRLAAGTASLASLKANPGSNKEPTHE